MAAVQCAVCERIAILKRAQCQQYFCGSYSRMVRLQREGEQCRNVRGYGSRCKPPSRECMIFVVRLLRSKCDVATLLLA